MAESNLPLRIQAYGHMVEVDLVTGDFTIDGSRLPFKFARHVELEYPISEELALKLGKGARDFKIGKLRPVTFRRVWKKFSAETLAEVGEIIVHAIGWQATVTISEPNPAKGKWEPKQVNVKHILYLHPDGSMVFG